MSPPPADTASLLADVAPRPRGRGLAHRLVDDLSQKIRDRQLRPGDKLPTESAIMQAYGVSRTVVREALSHLQAGGLVETHHGVGTFVLPPRAGMFRLEGADIATAVEVLALLELRISLETECAGLAAQRRSDAQLAAMREALDAFARDVEQGGDTVAHDFRFHLLIAEATGNRYFADILSHLGQAMIPRTRVSAIRQHAQRRDYLVGVNREHGDILAAIVRRDADAARAAMRLHLSNSRERLRLAQQAAGPGAPGR